MGSRCTKYLCNLLIKNFLELLSIARPTTLTILYSLKKKYTSFHWKQKNIGPIKVRHYRTLAQDIGLISHAQRTPTLIISSFNKIASSNDQ